MMSNGVLRRADWAMKALTGVAALALSLGVLAGAPGSRLFPTAHADDVVSPAKGAAVKNQPFGSSSTTGILLDSSIKPKDVVSVTFLDSQAGASGSGVTSWNAGAPASGSTVATDAVKGWAKQNSKDKSKWDVFYGTTTKGAYPSLPVWSPYLFSDFTALTTIENLNQVNTDDVMDMSYMFENCSQLQSVDVSSFNTAKVTDMSSMFKDCKQLSGVDVSRFDTSKVSGMVAMFSGCSQLSSVDLSSFNTANVANMRYMFSGCSQLSSVDLSGFNTLKVTDMEGMFSGCSQLQRVDVSHFDTSQVTSMYSMFRNCSGLTSLDLSSFDTSKVKPDASHRKDMLSGLSGLQSLQLGAQFTLKASEVGLGAPSQSVEKTGYTHDGKWHDAATGAAVDDVAGAGSYTTFRPNAYAVHFDGNAPQGATVTGSMAEQSFTYDVKQPLSANAFVRTGYTFLNWSTQSDGVGDGSYADGEEVSNLTAKDKDTVNLYAQWKANSYTVRFEAGADDASGRMADQSFTYDVKQALSANVFVRTGYAFAGWKVENGVSVLDADPRAGVYADGAEVMNLTADADGVVTLVAQWTKDAEPVKPSEPSAPSNPSTNPSKPSNPSAPSASRSSVTSAGKDEMSSLAATGVSGVPAVVVALVLVGVGVAISIVRRRA